MSNIRKGLNLNNPIPMGSEEKEKPNTTSYKSFHYLEDGSIEFSILSTKFTTKKLNSGVYDICTKNQGGIVVPRLEINNDNETFNQDLSFYFDDKINKQYNAFFDENIKSMVKKLGYNHKLGILLHGKQGTGKTSMFKKYFNDAVLNHNAIVFNFTNYNELSILVEFIHKIRTIQDNPIILFMDEFEIVFEYFGGESTLKKAMDGFNCIDNTMFMLATNYIEKVPDSIKKRPSRVKHCIQVKGIEDLEVIEKFLKNSFEIVGMDIDYSEEISKMKGNTIDELKQWVLDKIMDIQPEEKKSSSISLI